MWGWVGTPGLPAPALQPERSSGRPARLPAKVQVRSPRPSLAGNTTSLRPRPPAIEAHRRPSEGPCCRILAGSRRQRQETQGPVRWVLSTGTPPADGLREAARREEPHRLHQRPVFHIARRTAYPPAAERRIRNSRDPPGRPAAQPPPCSHTFRKTRRRAARAHYIACRSRLLHANHFEARKLQITISEDLLNLQPKRRLWDLPLVARRNSHTGSPYRAAVNR